MQQSFKGKLGFENTLYPQLKTRIDKNRKSVLFFKVLLG